MSADDVLAVLDALDARVWIDGGWGIDALLGEQTREHDDLDIVLDIDDLPRTIVALARFGYTLIKPWPDSPESFVLTDPADRRVDIHPLRFDNEGNGIQQIIDGEWTFPAAGLGGVGTIGGRRVSCLTADLQVLCHAGYELDDDDRRDMQALYERFGVELLAEQRPT